MILTEQLEEAEDGLHYNDYKTHLSLVLVLVPGAGLAIGRVEVVLGVRFTPVGVKGLLCGRRSLYQLLSHILRHDNC